MNDNDKVASQSLSAGIGAFRVGNRIGRSFDEILQEAIDDIQKHPTRARSITKKAARAIGIDLEKQFEEFADRRLNTLFARLRRASPVELREPTGLGSLSLLRGSLGSHLERATSAAKEQAAELAHTKTPKDAVAPLRNYTRTLSRTAANAAHNAAVLAVARRNANAVIGVMALATLDNRTTKEICVPRHGGAWSIPGGNVLPVSSIQIPWPGRPPWHHNCRTVLTILFPGEAPTQQTLDFNQWVQTDDAAEALGESVELYRSGVISPVRGLASLPPLDIRQLS